MRFLSYILFLSLLAINCTGPVKPDQPARDKKQPKEQIVVDFPAVIVLQDNSANDHPTDLENNEKTHAGDLLRPLNIPLLDKSGKNYLFIKSNGDTIAVNLTKLEPRHNLILFNHHSDPLLCRYSDLPLLLKQAFPEEFHLTENNFPAAENNDVSSAGRNSIMQNQYREQHPARLQKVVINISNGQKISLPDTGVPVEWVFHRINPERTLRITFENDLITLPNSDRYFTNGINIELQAPFLERLALNKLMIPYRKNATTTYTLGVYQDIFTPADTRIAPVLKKDRPYASYLMVGYRKSMANEQTRYSLTSATNMGYIGKHSPGKFLQSMTHETLPTNDPPIGWELQLNTDLILNYMIRVEKSFYSKPHLLLSYVGMLNVGTLNTDAGVGVNFVAGRFSPFFQPYRTATSKPFRYSFFLQGEAKAVAYNALLQGGAFSKDNVAALSSSQIERLVFSGEMGLRFDYRATAIELAQHFLSPEYKGGLPHRWGRISMIFGI